nr:PepSY-associated TM helix domain-containing protein [Wenzhouxiangella limi]
MEILRKLHLYIALVTALPLVLLIASGVALVYKTDFWQLDHPALKNAPVEGSAEEHARAIESMAARFDVGIEYVKYPQPELPAYHLWLADGREALVMPGSLEIVDQWRWFQRPTAFLAELHLHLLADEAGSRVVGWLGLLTLFLLVSGLVIWWPALKRFRWRSLWPRDLSRPRLLMFHRNLGALSFPVLLLLVACGTGVAYFQPTRSLLNNLFGDSVSAPLGAAPSAPEHGGEPLALEPLLAAAHRTLPEGRISFVALGAMDGGVLTVRKRMPSEPHPNGLSFVHLDTRTGEVLEVVDGSAASRGDRLANWMYPLHAGKLNPATAGGRLWQAVVTLSGVVMMGLVLAGLRAWVGSLRGTRMRSSKPAER